MFPPWIIHDTIASVSTKYSMAADMTCPHSRITNDQIYRACNEDH